MIIPSQVRESSEETNEWMKVKRDINVLCVCSPCSRMIVYRFAHGKREGDNRTSLAFNNWWVAHVKHTQTICIVDTICIVLLLSCTSSSGGEGRKRFLHWISLTNPMKGPRNTPENKDITCRPNCSLCTSILVLNLWSEYKSELKRKEEWEYKMIQSDFVPALTWLVFLFDSQTQYWLLFYGQLSLVTSSHVLNLIPFQRKDQMRRFMFWKSCAKCLADKVSDKRIVMQTRDEKLQTKKQNTIQILKINKKRNALNQILVMILLDCNLSIRLEMKCVMM